MFSEKEKQLLSRWVMRLELFSVILRIKAQHWFLFHSVSLGLWGGLFYGSPQLGTYISGIELDILNMRV